MKTNRRFISRLAQRIRLQGGVLFRRRYPRIADECHSKPFLSVILSDYLNVRQLIYQGVIGQTSALSS